MKDENCQSKIYAGCNWRWYNHKSSFRIKSHRNCTRFASRMWELKERNNYKSPNIRWIILKRAKPYSNDSGVWRLCHEQKLAVVKYPNQEKLLNETFEVMSGCKHTRSYTLGLYEPGFEYDNFFPFTPHSTLLHYSWFTPPLHFWNTSYCAHIK